MTRRVGARTTRDIPQHILQQLNAGHIESANLVEWLAIDHMALLASVLQFLQRQHYLNEIETQVVTIKKPTVNTLNATIGRALFVLGQQHDDAELLNLLTSHPADMVRCWACYSVVEESELTLLQRFENIFVLASDSHFGVREIAWMAMRPFIVGNLTQSIEILSEWAKHEDTNIRRFASEATRPRGVWCNHIDSLKYNPQQALAILEPLHADPERYVQDSVGNWLNDASKSRPEFVLQLCEKWKMQSGMKATDYIIKKALRTLNKP